MQLQRQGSGNATAADEAKDVATSTRQIGLGITASHSAGDLSAVGISASPSSGDLSAAGGVKAPVQVYSGAPADDTGVGIYLLPESHEGSPVAEEASHHRVIAARKLQEAKEVMRGRRAELLRAEFDTYRRTMCDNGNGNDAGDGGGDGGVDGDGISAHDFAKLICLAVAKRLNQVRWIKRDVG